VGQRGLDGIQKFIGVEWLLECYGVIRAHFARLGL
jgi:hypothetical protein